MKKRIRSFEEITDEEIKEAFANSYSSHGDHRGLIAQAVLTMIGGYYSPFTITQIMMEMRLLTNRMYVTKRGRQFVCDYFDDGSI